MELSLLAEGEVERTLSTQQKVTPPPFAAFYADCRFFRGASRATHADLNCGLCHKQESAIKCRSCKINYCSSCFIRRHPHHRAQHDWVLLEEAEDVDLVLARREARASRANLVRDIETLIAECRRSRRKVPSVLRTAILLQRAWRSFRARRRAIRRFQKCVDEDSGLFYFYDLQTKKSTWEPPTTLWQTRDEMSRAADLLLTPRSHAIAFKT